MPLFASTRRRPVLPLLLVAFSPVAAQFGGGGFGGGGFGGGGGGDGFLNQLMNMNQAVATSPPTSPPTAPKVVENIGNLINGLGGNDAFDPMAAMGNPAPATPAPAFDPMAAFGDMGVPVVAKAIPPPAPAMPAFDPMAMMNAAPALPIPKDCVVSSWSAYKVCSATCGGGLKIRTRSIVSKAENNGKACPAKMEEDSPCGMNNCPVDCVTGKWSVWCPCLKTCGREDSIREREILSHPKHGGKACGKLLETKPCAHNGLPCPIDCGVTSFMPWSKCTKSCGSGTQKRTRMTIIEPQHGGKDCPSLKETRACNTKGCPIDCVVATWSAWSTCSRSCKCHYCHDGEGSRFRTRKITVQPKFGGKKCAAVSGKEACNTHLCPVDCTVGPWGAYSKCTNTCGGGERHRNRVIVHKVALGGKQCPELQESGRCNTKPCQVDCVVTPWTPFSACSKSCGVGGTKYRTRKVLVQPLHGGVKCPGLKSELSCMLIPVCPTPAPTPKPTLAFDANGIGGFGGGGLMNAFDPNAIAAVVATPVPATPAPQPAAAFDPMAAMGGMGGGFNPNAVVAKATPAPAPAAFDPMAAMGGMGGGFNPNAVEKTASPTNTPSTSPTNAPTPHPCDDGSHGCDKGAGGICYKGVHHFWTCGCKNTYYCAGGCLVPHIGHTCALVTAKPTPKPTSQPTNFPTPKPTAHPTRKPTAAPTLKPTAAPTPKPTAYPTPKPTAAPTPKSTVKPTASPTSKPTAFDPMALMGGMGGMGGENLFNPNAMVAATPAPKATPAPAAFNPMAAMGGAPAAFNPNAMMAATPAPEATPAPAAFDPMAAMGGMGGGFNPNAMIGAVETKKPTSEPTAKPTSEPTAKPTSEPTAFPTRKPTLHPTQFPTPSPTPHPCDDGSHGCDKGPGGICYKGKGNSWTCGCKNKYFCSWGCINPHISHTCALVTSSPTATPTPKPTAYPTPKPTASPTSKPAAFDPMALMGGMGGGFNPNAVVAAATPAPAAFNPMAAMGGAPAAFNPNAMVAATPAPKATPAPAAFDPMAAMGGAPAAFNPNAMIGAVETKKPTSEPTLAPTTAAPTSQPTPYPTPSPTRHPCDDGSHGCDKGLGGICYKGRVAGGWDCGCKVNYWCSQGCNVPHIGHTCSLTTSTPTAAPTQKPTAVPAFDPMAMIAAAPKATPAPKVPAVAAFDPMAMIAAAPKATPAPKVPAVAAFDPMAMIAAAPKATPAPKVPAVAAFDPMAMIGAAPAPKVPAFNPNAVAAVAAFNPNAVAALPTSPPTAAAKLRVFNPNAVAATPAPKAAFDPNAVAALPVKEDGPSLDDMLKMAGGDGFEGLDFNKAAQSDSEVTSKPTSAPTEKPQDDMPDLAFLMNMAGQMQAADPTGAPTQSPTSPPTTKVTKGGDADIADLLKGLQDDDPTSFGAYDDSGVIGGGTCMGGYIKDFDLYLDCKAMIGFLAIIASENTDVDKLAKLKKIIPAANMKGPGGNGLVVKNNNNLKNVDGLGGLNLVAGGMVIEGNPKLKKAAGVGKQLLHVGKNDADDSLVVKNNPELEEFPELDKLIEGQIKGGLSVEDNAVLANIQGLNAVKKVGGAVKIQNNPLLENLGLDNLNNVGADKNSKLGLLIKNNPNLKSVAQLKKITSVLGSVVLEKLPALKTFEGLHSITKIGKDVDGNSLTIANNAIETLKGLRGLFGLIEGAVTVSRNDFLKSLDGLQSVSSVGANLKKVSLNVAANPDLQSLQGLDGLKGKLDGSVVVLMNPSLEKLAGLQKLSEIGKDLNGDSVTIQANDALKNLVGLEGLTKVDGALQITRNKKLKSLDGLQNVRTIAGKNRNGVSLQVLGNNDLVSADALEHLTNLAGGIVIKKNPLNDVVGLEQGLGPINGKVEIADVACVGQVEVQKFDLLAMMGAQIQPPVQQKQCKQVRKLAEGDTEVGDGVGHICGGTSTATWKVWSQFGSQGLSVDIDTTKCNFENLQVDKLKVPKYQTSIVGDSAHWQLTGVNSIYKATPTGFRLLLWHPVLRGKFMQYFAKRYNWKINWLADTGKTSGRTIGGKTGWRKVPKTKNVIYADVDTSKSGYAACPRYVASLHGIGDHWKVQGTHSIYHPNKKHFRLFVVYPTEITTEFAEKNKWSVAWVGSNDNRVSGNSDENWKAYNPQIKDKAKGAAIYIDVDTTKGQFPNTPTYVTAVSGSSHHWSVTGAGAIYSAAAKTFRLYLDQAKSVKFAKEKKWHVNYIAYSNPVDCILADWGDWSSCSKTCGGGHTFRTRTITTRAYFGGKCGKTYEKTECNARACAQNCVMSSWMPWSKCSKSCGRGVRGRTRHALVQAKNGGKECGVSSQAEYCDAGPCPVHCLVGAWGEWSPCTLSCGGGTQMHARKILRYAKFRGFKCPTTIESQQCNTQACPIDCVLAPWGFFSKCSATCGKGTKSRSRFVITQPKFGGKKCAALTNTAACDAGSCPVHCTVSSWGVWSGCTASCGSGDQRRFRFILQKAMHGGYSCPDLDQSRKCNTKLCPVDCVLSAWKEWDTCTQSCGGGTQIRSRRVVVKPQYGGRSCSFLSDLRPCNNHACPADCLTDNWSAWSACSKTCGNGTKKRTRFVIMLAQNGGKECPVLSQKLNCNSGPCPVHCSVSEWSDWSICTKTCGTGSQSRSRKILTHAKHGGYICPTLSGTQACKTQFCPIDCVVSAYGLWKACSHTCAGGVRHRLRYVLRKVRFGGKKCPALKDTGKCNTQACPVDCSLTPWGHWTPCSKTCGVGEQARQRHVIQNVRHGGRACGDLAETQVCNSGPCPIHCKVSTWSAWGKCSKTCGSGRHSRVRTILTHAKHNGFQCPSLEQEQHCNSQACPVDCAVSAWHSWAACTLSCGTGTKERKRVTLVQPAHGGKNCPPLLELAPCNVQPCPVDCTVSPWLGWSKCDKTCGTGAQIRSRMVLTPAANGGRTCPSLTSSQQCLKGPCPVHCVVSPWSKWTACSKSCGTGHRIRIRAIMQTPKHGGYVCPNLRESSNCNTQSCAVDCVVSKWGTWDNFVKGGAYLQRTRSVVVPASDGGKKCPALVEKKHNSIDCKETVAYGAWSKCTKACASGHQWRHWERNVCSQKSVLQYKLKATQGRACNTFDCEYAKDDVVVKVEIPAIHPKKVIANALMNLR